jgi:cytoskeletal protein CcmA (bactofilin family)
MLGKKNKQEFITTFLCPLTSIEGRIEFEGTIRLDGKVKGHICDVEGGEGTVIIGEKAKIEADLKVDSAIIMGEVTGCIFARKKIEVYPPASVNGDMNAPVISIDSGAVFNGKCTTSSRDVSLNGKYKTDDNKNNLKKTTASPLGYIKKEDDKQDSLKKKLTND